MNRGNLSESSLTTTIVEKVADREGCDPGELPRLYDKIDPDALNTLFAPTESGRTRVGGRIKLTFCGYRINISDGRVRIRDPEDYADAKK